MNTNQQKNKTKKLIFTIGSKGGVGKTLAMLALYDTLKTSGKPFYFVDCDTENASSKTGLTAYTDAPVHDLRDTSTMDFVIQKATEQNTILDLPANAGAEFLSYFKQTIDSSILKELNLEFVALGVITPDADSLLSVISWMETLQKTVRYGIVLNELRHQATQKTQDEIFSYFGEKAKKVISPDWIISLPGVYPESIKAWHSHKCPLAEVLAKVSILDRSRLSKFKTRVNEEFSKLVNELQ